MVPEKKKYTRKQLVKTIWYIDALVGVLILFVVYLFYKRYALTASLAHSQPLPSFPRTKYLTDFVPLDEAGKIEVCQHFLSYEEIDAVLDLIQDAGGWKESATGGPHFLVPIASSFETSIQKSPVISAIEKRIANATSIPMHPNEDMIHVTKITSHGKQIRQGNYPPFGLHHDTDTRPWRQKTLLIYLTTVPEGGRTIFPLSVPLNKEGILTIKMVS